MIRGDYREMMSEFENSFPFLRNPHGFVSMVIRRHFQWAIDRGIPFEELFHEGVIAVWMVKNDKDPQSKSVSYLWTAIRWWVAGYIRGIISCDILESSLSDEGDTDKFARLLRKKAEPIDSIEGLDSFEALVEDIMRVLREKGLQGSACYRLREGTEEKIRQILYFLAAGYNGKETAELMGYKGGHSSVNRQVAALTKKLRMDDRFMSRYGELLPSESDRRRGRLAPRDGVAVEVSQEAFLGLIPEDILETAGRLVGREKLTSSEEAQLSQFREDWSWLID